MSNDNFTTIKVECDDNGILMITLDRPDKLNALSEQVLDELGMVFYHAKENNDIRGIIITGNGKAFCAGADINELAKLTASSGYDFAKQGQAIFRLLETLGKPSIAAINGYAFGGGCELAMAANIRIASTNAQFSQPEVKLGVLPGYGGTQRLSRLIGKGRATDMCISGRFIDADTAYAWGLVTDIVDPSELVDYAKKHLTTICNMGPLAVSTTIDVIDRGYDMPIDDALHLEALSFAQLCDTLDKTEGTTAFIQKRSAHFLGE